MESWKKLNFANYEVSDLGNIRNLPNRTRRKSKLLKPVLTWRGYHRICLMISGKKTYHYVHRLIASAFLDSSANETINHINGIKTDNRAINLEWLTLSDNLKHSFKIGLRSLKGAKHNRVILKEGDVRKILQSNKTQEILAAEFGVHRTTISAIKTRRSWPELV